MFNKHSTKGDGTAPFCWNHYTEFILKFFFLVLFNDLMSFDPPSRIQTICVWKIKHTHTHTKDTEKKGENKKNVREKNHKNVCIS